MRMYTYACIYYHTQAFWRKAHLRLQYTKLNFWDAIDDQRIWTLNEAGSLTCNHKHEYSSLFK